MTDCKKIVLTLATRTFTTEIKYATELLREGIEFEDKGRLLPSVLKVTNWIVKHYFYVRRQESYNIQALLSHFVARKVKYSADRSSDYNGKMELARNVAKSIDDVLNDVDDSGRSGDTRPCAAGAYSGPRDICA